MSEQEKMDADLRQIVTDALVSMVSGVTGLVPPTGPGAIPDFIQAPIDRAVERISADLPVGVLDGSIYVECRQCDVCQHGGINDAAAGLAACHDCDWTGPDPVEDKCPGCQSENSMAAACPKCGSRYVLVASEDIAAPVAPTVKAEQVRCATCQGSGIVGHSEVCPECQDTWQPAPSLPAAVSADLTAVRCQCCATEYPHDSYDAGFIAGSGMCQACDAAMPPKDLPAAGSAVEEVEVVAVVRPIGFGRVAEPVNADSLYLHCSADDQLMTVAQHERIVASLQAEIAKRDAAIEEWSGTAVQNGMEVDRLTAALSAQQSAQPEFCCKHSYKVAKQAAWGARDLTQCKCDHNEYCEHCWPDDFREGGKWHGGFETKQSAHVSVPRELLKSAACLLELGDIDGPTYRELRALLASHAEGGKV